jgi:hypothetical protein
MGRIRPEDADKYQNSSGEFFILKDDKDTAVVHFMAETLDDLDIYVIHKVKDGDKTRNVSCLRNAGEPVDNCPLCASGFKPEVRVFAQMYDVNEGKIKVWDRGKSFLQLLEPISRRNPKLYEVPIEIERNGKAGDAKTRYSLFPLVNDENYPIMQPEDFPEPIEICGREKTIVLDKTYEELEDFLNGASLVEGSEQAQEEPKQRQSLRKQPQEQAPQQKRESITPRGRRTY